MKKTLITLCAISLAAFGIELFSVLYDFFGRQAVHPKVEGLNSLATLIANPTLCLAIGSFFLIGVFAHLVLAASSWTASLAANHWIKNPQTNLLIGILFLGLQILLLRASNQAYFPKSLHEQALPIADHWALPLLIISVVLIPSTMLIRYLASRPYITATSLAALVATIGLVGAIQNDEPPQLGKNSQPNIIILGVDSLRPDHMIGGDYETAANTPFLDQQLGQSTWYRNAYTPAARTYPAWASLLTGAYPRGHGVRFGLTGNKQAKASGSIAWKLKENGYHTIYAMDERRFSYIDQAWGFEDVVGPKAGAADFVLGTLHDISVLNLLTLVPRADLFLPYTVNNRAIEALYDPARFAHDTARHIQSTPQNKPIFFATHLCLPHWPFGWKDKDAEYGWQDSLGRQQAYGDALSESDKQLATIWKALEESGRLDNSIVIFMSDHGEGHGLHDDHIASAEQLVSDDPLLTPIINTTGHGTNILAIKQHEVLLAIQDRRAESISATTVAAPASLLDVYATIDEAAFGKSTFKADTRSLLHPEQIVNDTPNWHLFFESGFTVKALRKLNPNIEEVASQSMSYYHLTPTGRLAIRDDLWDTLITAKQRGIMTANQSMLAVTQSELGSDPLVSFFDAESQTLSPIVSTFNNKTLALKELLYSHFDQEFSSLNRVHPTSTIEK